MERMLMERMQFRHCRGKYRYRGKYQITYNTALQMDITFDIGNFKHDVKML